jgi:hypothetical protein
LGTKRGCGAPHRRPKASSGAMSEASGRLSVASYKTDQLVCKVRKWPPDAFGRRRGFGWLMAGFC